MGKISFIGDFPNLTWRDKIRSKWQTFVYNYGWSTYVPYIDGWIPRFSLFFPIVGYLILFNDTVSDALVFTHLTNTSIEWGLTGGGRLRFLYFGLLFLGASNFIYRLRRPFAFKFGTNLTTYTRSALELFTYGDYLNLHNEIRNGMDPFTRDGKYYDSEWDGFVEAAVNRDEGTENVERSGNWEEAKRQYGSLLRSILRETFYRVETQHRTALTVCLILSSAGYFLLLVPGLDLFLKVVQSTFLA